jgi:hypothetical protein
MGEDEAGTLSALRHLRTNIFAAAVDAHRGKIVKSMGDVGCDASLWCPLTQGRTRP